MQISNDEYDVEGCDASEVINRWLALRTQIQLTTSRLSQSVGEAVDFDEKIVKLNKLNNELILSTVRATECDFELMQQVTELTNEIEEEFTFKVLKNARSNT